METQKSQLDKLPSPAAPAPVVSSCRKKKNEEATFLEDLKDHIDEFIDASMDEHKTCFKKTIQKVLPRSSVLSLPYMSFLVGYLLCVYWCLTKNLGSFSDVWNVKNCSRKECWIKGSWKCSAPSNNSVKIEYLPSSWITW